MNETSGTGNPPLGFEGYFEQPIKQENEESNESCATSMMNETSNFKVNIKKEVIENDPLSTLASAALGCDQADPHGTNVKNDPDAGPESLQRLLPKIEPSDALCESNICEKPIKKYSTLVLVPPLPLHLRESLSPKLYDVGIVKGTSSTITSYLVPPSTDDQSTEDRQLTTDTLPNFDHHIKMKLEPGAAYKICVAAINSCGQSPWSEVCAFRTRMPGFPGAPCCIKIAKSLQGAHMSWDPPPNQSAEIIEYSLYLAVSNNALLDETAASTSTQASLGFIRVYIGTSNQCVVPATILAAAYIDQTLKPAIILRIAACNHKGYGPATQVRWLQEPPPQPPPPSPPQKNTVRKHSTGVTSQTTQCLRKERQGNPL